MKTQDEVSKNWDDLVFENRNKEYGAYLVRKAYSQNMTTGLGISVCLACFLIIAPKIFKSLFPDAPIIAQPLIEILDGEIDIIQPPIIEPPVKQVTPLAPQQQTNFPPAVTTEPVEADEILTNDQIEQLLTDATSGEGTVPGPSTEGPVVEAPPAPTGNEIFNGAEVMPAYKGGMKEMMQFISRRVRYPGVARRNGTEGTVYVGFVIDREGKVTNITLVKGISEECDKEAMRVIGLMNDWSAGMQNNRAVNVRMTLPIKFQLEK
jgi:protein TonB